KETDVGGASGPPTAWAIPVINFTDCMILPIFRGSVIQNFGDFPQHGTALTPTCDPTKLSTNGPNPANTYFNQLGCALVQQATGRVQATTPETAATYLFTAGIKSGLFSIALTSVNTLAPGEAGKVNGMSFTYYAQIPAGLRLDSAVITPDGQFLLGGSSRTNHEIYACRHPLGHPPHPPHPRPPPSEVGPHYRRQPPQRQTARRQMHADRARRRQWGQRPCGRRRRPTLHRRPQHREQLPQLPRLHHREHALHHRAGVRGTQL